MDHDHGNDRTPATRCAIGIKPVAVSLSNAPPTATPSSVMSRLWRRGAARDDRDLPAVMMKLPSVQHLIFRAQDPKAPAYRFQRSMGTCLERDNCQGSGVQATCELEHHLAADDRVHAHVIHRSI